MKNLVIILFAFLTFSLEAQRKIYDSDTIVFQDDNAHLDENFSTSQRHQPAEVVITLSDEELIIAFNYSIEPLICGGDTITTVSNVEHWEFYAELPKNVKIYKNDYADMSVTFIGKKIVIKEYTAIGAERTIIAEKRKE